MYMNTERIYCAQSSLRPTVLAPKQPAPKPLCAQKPLCPNISAPKRSRQNAHAQSLAPKGPTPCAYGKSVLTSDSFIVSTRATYTK